VGSWPVQFVSRKLSRELSSRCGDLVMAWHR
jgi:hypothetical protein